ncbi:MAG: LysR family transcriptional regulator [Gammaproteobacteria bacterium]|nr:LysR family transcriptional regulator [Gammaproteobacteria bacterium]
MSNLRALEVFLAVVDQGSFAAAGETIGLTQSAISLQIKALEQDFETLLFDRSKRPPILNAEGVLLAQKSRQLINQFNELKQSFIEHNYSGTLHIGTVPSVLTGILPCALSAMRKKHPRLLVNLITGLSRELTIKVQKGEIDAAIVTEPQHISAELNWQPFAAEPLVVISPPGTEGLLDTELLSRYPFLQFKKHSWVENLIDTHLKNRNIQVEINMAVDSLESISMMVAEGLGVSIVPLRSHCQNLNSKVVISPFGKKPVKRIVGLIQREANPNADLIKVLHEILLSKTALAVSNKND